MKVIVGQGAGKHCALQSIHSSYISGRCCLPGARPGAEPVTGGKNGEGWPTSRSSLPGQVAVRGWETKGQREAGRAEAQQPHGVGQGSVLTTVKGRWEHESWASSCQWLCRSHRCCEAGLGVGAGKDSSCCHEHVESSCFTQKDNQQAPEATLTNIRAVMANL